MKKILLLIFTSIIFTGCTAEYNLYIKSDNQVEESIVVNNIIADKKQYKNIQDAISQEYGYMLSEYNYDITHDYENGVLSYKINKTDNIKNIFKNSIYKEVYEDYELFDSAYSINFKNTGSNYISSLFVSKEYENKAINKEDLKEVKVNIKFDNEVLSTNADSYDESTNTYTWIINRNDNDKDIKFSYKINENELSSLNNNNKKKNSIQEMDKLKVIIIIFSLLLLISLVVFIIGRSINIKKNRI